MNESKFLVVLTTLGFIILGWSPKADRITWFMENAPVLVLLPLTIYLQPKVQLSKSTLRWMVAHAFVLMIGGHYTYAEVPAGFWMQDALGLARNHYDRLGHFMQGFVPALVFWELLLRFSPLRQGRLLALIVVCMCLSVSAVYEFIEWWAAVLLGQGADAFLGTQGDVWDTQWDMFMATLGASMAVGLRRLK